MAASTAYRNCQNGNNFWTLHIGEERNKNSIRIHSNDMGKTIYETHEVWDSDFFKIIRLLHEHQYDRTNLKAMIKKINSQCRHLEIPIIIALYR